MAMQQHCAMCSVETHAIFKCEGCQDVFCAEHSHEHRNELNQQIGDILVEYNQLQDRLIRSDPSNLMRTIKQWENESIDRIRRAAEETRVKLRSIIEEQKEGLAKELEALRIQLERAQRQSNFLETDLQKWSIIVQKLNNTVPTNTHPSIIIEEDEKNTLIGNLKIIENLPSVDDDERFGECFGPVEIKKDGHLAQHTGDKRSYAFIRGINEYSKSRYKIRFMINKLNARWPVFFGIFPKGTPLPRDASDLRQVAYGWYSDDTSIADGAHLSAPNDYRDLLDQLTLNIELEIDCGRRRIEYYNQQTRQRRDIDVNLQRCPLPWQSLFFLYDVQTNVQIRSVQRVLLS